MTEQDIESSLSVDYSAGTERFRDALLARCLEILDDDAPIELGDSDLELLAAAGSEDALLGERRPADAPTC